MGLNSPYLANLSGRLQTGVSKLGLTIRKSLAEPKTIYFGVGAKYTHFLQLGKMFVTKLEGLGEFSHTK